MVSDPYEPAKVNPNATDEQKVKLSQLYIKVSEAVMKYRYAINTKNYDSPYVAKNTCIPELGRYPLKVPLDASDEMMKPISDNDMSMSNFDKKVKKLEAKRVKLLDALVLYIAKYCPPDVTVVRFPHDNSVLIAEKDIEHVEKIFSPFGLREQNRQLKEEQVNLKLSNFTLSQENKQLNAEIAKLKAQLAQATKKEDDSDTESEDDSAGQKIGFF